MNDFDFNEDFWAKPAEKDLSEKTATTPTQNVSKPSYNLDFDEDFWVPQKKIPDEPESLKKDEAYQKFYKVPEISADDIDKMSWAELQELSQRLNTEREYLTSKGAIKHTLSDLTLGLSERIPGLKPDEYGMGSILGSTIGSAIPFLGIHTALSIPLKYIPKAYKWSTRLGKTAISAASMGSFEALHEIGKGEKPSLTNIAIASALGAGGDLLFRGMAKAYQFYKSLSPSQRSQLLVQGIIPDNLSPTSYRFLQDEVVPEIHALSKQEYQKLAQEAEAASIKEYQQKIQNTRAKHENDLEAIEQKFKQDQEAYAAAQREHQHKIETVKAKHQNELEAVEASNLEKQAAYEAEKTRYNHQLQNVRAKHENKLNELERLNQLDTSTYEKELTQYEREIKNIKAKHQNKLDKLEKENQKALQDYETAKQRHEAETKKVEAENQARIDEARKQNEQSDLDFQNEKKQYQNKLNHLAAEHQNELDKLNQANKKAEEEFQVAQFSYEQQKAKDKLVSQKIEQANQRPETDPLTGRITHRNLAFEAEFLPEIPTPKQASLNKISPNRITDSNKTGKALTEAIRTSDDLDYGIVNELYRIAEKENAGISQEAPKLYSELNRIKAELSTIPAPSTPEKQKLATIDQILNKLFPLDDAGNPQFLPINNKQLLDQAKSIRYTMDFDFAHGNTRGIFSPLITALEETAEQAAINTGKESAYEASRTARAFYRNWAETYDNKYIRPFRDKSNQDFIQNLQSAYHIDNFLPVQNVLEKTYAGKELSNTIRRQIVDQKIGKFLDNPKRALGQAFEDELSELTAILSTDEKKFIKDNMAAARRAKRDIRAVKGTKIEKPTKPTPKIIEKVDIPLFKRKPKEKVVPKLKEAPEFRKEKPEPKSIEEITIPKFTKEKPEPRTIKQVDIPLFREKPPEKQIIKEVAIPKLKAKPPEKGIIKQVDIPKYHPPKETKEMAAAAKIGKTTPEDIQRMMKTPTGMKEIESMLSKSPNGKKLYDKIAEHNLKSRLQRKKVITEYTGDELADILNREDNYDMFSAILGEQETEQLLDVAIDIGKEKLRRDKLKKLTSPDLMKTLLFLHLL